MLAPSVSSLDSNMASSSNVYFILPKKSITAPVCPIGYSLLVDEITAAYLVHVIFVVVFVNTHAGSSKTIYVTPSFVLYAIEIVSVLYSSAER